MTPMIDVVFLLPVFFVCASVGQLPDALLPAELSAGTTDSAQPAEPADNSDPDHQEIRVGLRVGPQVGSLRMLLNDVEIATADELRSRLIRLSEIDPLTHIILDVEDAVSVQQFVRIYDLCQALGFEEISFGVRN